MEKQKKIKLLQMKIEYSKNIIRLENLSIEFYEDSINKLNGEKEVIPQKENEIKHFNK